LKIAVFVSGRGSNLQAIINSKLSADKIKIESVVSDKSECAAFHIAEKYSIPAYTIGNKPGSKTYNELIFIFNELKVELIVLAGYLKLIPADFIKHYKNKIINIHPALLPLYGGKGMFGMNVHKAVFAAEEKLSGATVHFVDEIYDNGLIIAQEKVDISGIKSPEEIAERVLKAEHKLLPFVISKFAENKIKIIDNKVEIL
jgi:formyltetrahydrofolate-dependent phosphoribosylglycinamide formyltransferase